MNEQALIIYKLLEQLEEKYLTTEKIRRAIVEDDTARQNTLEMIEALCQAVITSLNFGNYKRAVKYLALATDFCERYSARLNAL